MLVDTFHRPLQDLRISVTDRCNFRCTYCMPREAFGPDHVYLPHAALLSFEEVTRVARLFVQAGVTKLRLTGGEPLLRKGIELLISQLAELRTPQGQPVELTMTTNGVLLPKKAQTLKDAGLNRLTISLDALEDATFQRMADVDLRVEDVLAGIAAAQQAGFERLKVNMVVQRGVNDQEVLPMAQYFRGRDIQLRFIEYMDVGNTNGWRMDHVLPSSEVRARIHAQFPLEAVERHRADATAQTWRYVDGTGDIGFISSVTEAFCGDCTRMRLSTDGQLYTCLFAHQGTDLKTPLRAGANDTELGQLIAGVWTQRADRYSERRAAHQGSRIIPLVPVHADVPEQQPARPRIEMSYIGG